MVLFRVFGNEKVVSEVVGSVESSVFQIRVIKGRDIFLEEAVRILELLLLEEEEEEEETWYYFIEKETRYGGRNIYITAVTEEFGIEKAKIHVSSRGKLPGIKVSKTIARILTKQFQKSWNVEKFTLKKL